MSQDLAAQNVSAQELTVGGNNTTTGFATGTTCTSSGTYRAENKYMAVVALYAAGEVFRLMTDGKKTIWYPLTQSTATNKEGSFTSVKVEAGAV